MDSLMQTDHALPQRRHRKMLKDGSAEVWPQDAEDVFLEGLKDYWNSPWANTSRGRSRWRNQYLVDYLKKFGIERSKKQVASHIQVLRNMWKGHPEFALVAGPDAMSEGSSTSDRYSPPQRSNKLTSRSPTSRRRPSISHSSPPSTPTSNGSEYSEAVLKDPHHPQGLHLSPSITSQPPVIKSEHLQSPQGSLFEPSGLPSVPEVALEQPQSAAPNSTVGFCLWAQNIEPTYVDVDALPFVDKPTSPGSPVPPQLPLRGIPRACLRFTLRLPTEGSGCDAMGFSGAITFSRPLASSARVVTRVHINNVPVSQEVQPLVPVHDQANAALTGQAMQERHVAMLPDSCLSRCNLLNTAGKKTRIIQQVIVDAEPLFVVGYDLYRLPVPHLTAELSSWTKVVDNRPPPEPSLDPLPIGMGRFGAGSSANEYLYGTAGSLPAHVSRNTPPHSHGFGHSRGHSVGSPTVGHPISPTTSLGSTQISASLSTGPSQATPTHANFTTLGSPMAPTSPHGSSSGSSTARSRSSFSQGNVGMGMGMTSGVNFPLAHHGHGNGHGSLMGSENFGQDPWTSNLLPLF
ncbi:uncharacterized protein FOMMEDRAFT_145345 [Fomitiporia mediterranea MF3/22]|uniref:uncharacterized protein n=1 Tax=Fomitiporia mediterranea (strain MF3/22) TaxID=694068 RepID=UPI0004408B9C|nr:uncharacterized protein FOMMEDRAFT_145345 [Fomitiporia mediterranea MF3/22]EJD06017.1 hypothetical protein FOMMEDRAFT_145345 [Fomitiporia mediterranea MF3/22]